MQPDLETVACKVKFVLQLVLQGATWAMLRIRSALHQDLYLNFDPQVAHLPIYAVFAKNPWLTKVLPPYLPPVALQVKFVLRLHSDTYYKATLEPCCASNPLRATIYTPTSTPMTRIYRYTVYLVRIPA